LKKALITGITGQDGSYLAELLLDKGYQVHGIKRKSSSFNTDRINHIFDDSDVSKQKLFLHYGDLGNSSNLVQLINEIQPEEIYNLGAQSHVGTSFEIPEYTADVNALGTLRILEAIRFLGFENKIKFYQASSSELFGKVVETPQNENTPFYPRSPYGVAKLFAYWITVNYRESYGMFACNGILFNHESPRRGETFVTRKITRGLCNIVLGIDKELHLGNLDAMRDWGYAPEYVKCMWMMLQQEKPKDYVLAVGKQHSVRDFILLTAEILGFKIEFRGKSFDEVGIIVSNNGKISNQLKKGDVIIRVEKKYFRPSEVDTLLGDSSLASNELNWKPQISITDLCEEMVESDLKLAYDTLKLNK